MYRYRFYRANNKVIAISTFAGKTVKGIAKCDPSDEFSMNIGEELAAARCNNKIAAKRVRCAQRKLDEAVKALEFANSQVEFATKYLNESTVKYEESVREVDEILSKFN